MENIYKLPLMLEPQPEGGYTITCPLLPNLVTEADTLDEVIPNVADALAALIEAYEDLNQPLPAVLQPLTPDSTLWTETLVPVVLAWNTKKWLKNYENLVARKFHAEAAVLIGNGTTQSVGVLYQYLIGETKTWKWGRYAILFTNWI